MLTKQNFRNPFEIRTTKVYIAQIKYTRHCSLLLFLRFVVSSSYTNISKKIEMNKKKKIEIENVWLKSQKRDKTK